LSQVIINIGNAPNDGTGDALRTAFDKTNQNFTDLYDTISTVTNGLVNSSQLSANLSNYQTTAGLSANVAKLTANTTTFVGSVSAANVVSNAQLTANLTNYALLSNANFTANVNVTGSANLSLDLNVGRNLTVAGNLTVSGNTFIVGANNLIVQDAVISLHTAANLAPLVSNDGKLVGVAFHYYDSSDKQGLLSLNQSNAFLTYYKTSSDASVGDPVGNTLGTIQADTFYAGNGSVYATVNSTIYSGTANNVTYVGNVTAANVVSNNQLQANLGNYQTTAGLNTNIAAYLPLYNGIVNAASINVGSSFIANSTQVSLSSTPLSANGSNGTSGYVLTSNGSTGSPYWQSMGSVGVNTSAQYTWTNTIFYANNIQVLGNNSLIVNAGAKIIDSVGSQGTAGQVLTSNGAGNVYWAAAAAGVNSAAQYTWTNTHTFSNTVTINNNLYANVVNATSYNTGTIYGTTLGGFLANTTFMGIGNSATNVAINTTAISIGGGAATLNSTVYTGTSNNASYLGGSLNFSANSSQLTLNTIPFSANGGKGSAGQVLTSNGSTGSPYWSTISTNVSAQYAWTNTQTFSNTVTFSANIDLSGSTIQNYQEYANGYVNTGTAITVSANSNIVRYTLTNNCTITLPSGQPTGTNAMKSIVVMLKQDATGGRTMAFAAPSGQSIKYNNSATQPAVVSDANKVTIYVCQKYDGDTAWYISLSYIDA
jgi:hypothetical protein